MMTSVSTSDQGLQKAREYYFFFVSLQPPSLARSTSGFFTLDRDDQARRQADLEDAKLDAQNKSAYLKKNLEKELIRGKVLPID